MRRFNINTYMAGALTVCTIVNVLKEDISLAIFTGILTVWNLLQE